jgi:hypothetical protein
MFSEAKENGNVTVRLGAVLRVLTGHGVTAGRDFHQSVGSPFKEETPMAGQASALEFRGNSPNSIFCAARCDGRAGLAAFLVKNVIKSKTAPAGAVGCCEL